MEKKNFFKETFLPFFKHFPAPCFVSLPVYARFIVQTQKMMIPLPVKIRKRPQTHRNERAFHETRHKMIDKQYAEMVTWSAQCSHGKSGNLTQKRKLRSSHTNDLPSLLKKRGTREKPQRNTAVRKTRPTSGVIPAREESTRRSTRARVNEKRGLKNHAITSFFRRAPPKIAIYTPWTFYTTVLPPTGAAPWNLHGLLFLQLCF